MGAFFKYETSMARLFDIDTATSKIKRPNRKIKKPDILGAFIVIDGASVFPLSVSDDDGDLTIIVAVNVSTTVEEVTTTAPAFVTITYDLSDDTFTYGNTELTNIMIDGFGKVVTQ